jgi:signal transduction histidine kinase
LQSLSLGIDSMALSRNLDAADRETLQIMRDSSGFMSETLNAVLTLQKIEEGKLELECDRFEPREVVAKAASTLRGVMIAREIVLDVSIDDSVPAALIGDRMRIEHVLVNLLSNAIKFSLPKGCITLAMQATPMTQPRTADDALRSDHESESLYVLCASFLHLSHVITSFMFSSIWHVSHFSTQNRHPLGEPVDIRH